MGWWKQLYAIHWQDWILQSFMMVCLIFHTAIIINRKNWRITIKLHFENVSNFFFKKWMYTHARTPLALIVFVHFSMMPPSLLDKLTFCTAPNISGEDCPERREAWTVCRFKKRLDKKRVGRCFWGARLIPQYKVYEVKVPGNYCYWSPPLLVTNHTVLSHHTAQVTR